MAFNRVTRKQAMSDAVNIGGLIDIPPSLLEIDAHHWQQMQAASGFDNRDSLASVFRVHLEACKLVGAAALSEFYVYDKPTQTVVRKRRLVAAGYALSQLAIRLLATDRAIYREGDKYLGPPAHPLMIDSDSSAEIPMAHCIVICTDQLNDESLNGLRPSARGRWHTAGAADLYVCATTPAKMSASLTERVTNITGSPQETASLLDPGKLVTLEPFLSLRSYIAVQCLPSS